MHIPLSILDLVPIREGATAREAIATSMRAVELADRVGFHRYWFAEHHNTSSLASSATALLIHQAASKTEKIRVGSGGVMLPNHSPLVVAEYYGTLAHMFPDRIDLGLGRAPGTDPMTARLLHRTSADPQTFANAVVHMQGWMSDAGMPADVPISSAASAGTNVPMWVLGSTTNGAAIAAQLGLPFSVASHFAPAQLHEALQLYRTHFNPDAVTAQIAKPHTMVGVNVTVAETDEEAKFLFTTHQQMFLANRTGKRTAIQPPRPLAEFADVTHGEWVNAMLRVNAVGSPETVVAKLEALQESTGADEFIITNYVFDEEKMLRSHELLAEAWLG